MSFVYRNENPEGARVGDCTVRAISLATGQPWEKVYWGLCVEGMKQFDMPSANSVWGAYLKHNGFVKVLIPDACPDCYTVRDFCRDHPRGTFVLATGSHVICAKNGTYYDTWDSGSEVPIYYFAKGR